MYSLSKDAVATSNQDVKVYINNVKIDPIHYTYSAELDSLTIHCNLEKSDLIEVEYLVDKMIYEHFTHNKCEYRIEPVYKYSHLLGRHTIL